MPKRVCQNKVLSHVCQNMEALEVVVLLLSLSFSLCHLA